MEEERFLDCIVVGEGSHIQGVGMEVVHRKMVVEEGTSIPVGFVVVMDVDMSIPMEFVVVMDVGMSIPAGFVVVMHVDMGGDKVDMEMNLKVGIEGNWKVVDMGKN